MHCCLSGAVSSFAQGFTTTETPTGRNAGGCQLQPLVVDCPLHVLPEAQQHLQMGRPTHRRLDSMRDLTCPVFLPVAALGTTSAARAV